MEKSPYRKIQTVLFTLMGGLVAALLFYLWITPNIEMQQNREMEGYECITDVSYREIADASAPTGIVREFCFPLEEEMAYDTTLMFTFSHQNAEVYLGEEKVYALRTADALSVVRTPGANWAMIPLYREDIGKEVRVLLTPVYENYQDQKIEFLMGSRFAIYRTQFMKSLPEMALSTIDILAGLVLLGTAIYFSFRKVKDRGFYALALLAISLGLWNFTQTEFAPLILKEKTIFVYYVSLTMLLVCSVPLLKSVKGRREQMCGQLLDGWCVVCGVLGIVQLLLQLFGILDLREMLKVTHGMIAISSLVLILSAVIGWKKRGSRKETDRKASGVWLLGVGALMDLVLYYVTDTSSGLLFVLIAILCYVLMEGFRIYSSYTRQKQMLEEKETQLTLSRITTMMSQIRSHFVFNILNAISGMCKYDPEKADETVVRFARYLRNNIDIMEDDHPVLFSTELLHLEDYVMLEQVRFGDKISFDVDIRAEQFRIPPLILQPVVENAIKHGLTKKQSGGTVTLRTWEEGETIRISVEDDGVGFALSELEKKNSVGLKNIRYRLEHLMHGTLEIESQEGVGTTVTITIPKGGE